MKEVFFYYLKEGFYPKLRENGFKGSGQNFRRVTGEVIHTLNIQANKYGGSCCLNMGMHLTFLPYTWSGEPPDVKRIRECDCEFRERLGENGFGDKWWKYDGGIFGSPRSSAYQLMNTYWSNGEPILQKYLSVDDVANLYTLDDLERKEYLPVFGGITRQRGALAMARILNHLKRNEEAVLFAEFGLKHLGAAKELEHAFKQCYNRVAEGS